MRHEALGGQLRAAQIAARQAGAAQADLAGSSRRDRLQAAAEEEDLVPGQGTADGGLARAPLDPLDALDAMPGRVHRAFGRAVEIEDGLPLRLRELSPEGLVHGLARGEHDPRAGQAVEQPRVRQEAELGRGAVQQVDSPGLQEAEQRRSIRADVFRHDAEGMAGEKQHELLHRGIEDQRCIEAGEQRTGTEAGLRQRGEHRRLESGKQVESRAVLDLNPFGPACRPRRIDGIGEIAGPGSAGGPLGRPQSDGGGLLVEPRAADQKRSRPVFEEIFEEKGQPPGRLGRVEGDVEGAGLPDGEDGHHRVGRAVQAQCDRDLRSGSRGAQVMGQAVGPHVQLSEGQEVAGEQGEAIRSAVHPVLEDRGQGLALPEAAGGLRHRVPLDPRLMELGFGKQRQVRQGPVRIGDGAREETLEAVQQPADRGEDKQGGGVLGRSNQCAAVLLEAHREVEPRRAAAAGRAHRPQAQALDHQVFKGSVLQHEHRLEQGRVGEAPLRRQLLDQPLERQVLVSLGGQRGLARPAEQPAERELAVLVSRQLAAQHQHVDEEPDQALDLRPVAPRDGRAHCEVLLAAIARQESLEAGEEHHEERRHLAPGESLCLPGELRRQAHRA